MRYLISLFAPRPLHRSFALLDRNGHCQAFKQCSLQPMGDGGWKSKKSACTG